jgi:hypothetical protein
MSIYSEDSLYEDSPYESFEYNPCIRKGKHKPVHKKVKKYEAKVQKMNLIRTKRHKVIYSDGYVEQNDQSKLKILLNILQTTDWGSWNDDYEYLYRNVYKLYEDETYQAQYEKVQQELHYDDYDYDDDMDSYYSYCRWEYRMMRWGKYWGW